MKYFFVFISIVAVWLAVVIMAATVDNFSALTAQRVAILTTIILFIVGFKR